MAKAQKEVLKIMSFGVFDYEFNVNLTQSELKEMNIILPEIISIKDVYKHLKNEKFRNKFEIKSKNNLINLLLFLNLSNNIKTPVEFFSLNSIALPKELHYFNNKIRNNFINNKLLILESNILPAIKCRFIIAIEGIETKILEEDFSDSISSENKKDTKKLEEQKTVTMTNLDTKNVDNKETKKVEEKKMVEIKKSEDVKKLIEDKPKFEDKAKAKAEDKKVEEKKDDNLNLDRKTYSSDDIFSDANQNQVDNKVNQNQENKDENKVNESQSNNSIIKNNQDPLVVIINKSGQPFENSSNSENPKGKDFPYEIETINLPNVKKPSDIVKEINNQVEGKDDKFKINPNEFRKNQESILMFTRKSNVKSTEKNDENLMKKEQNTYDKINLEEQLKYNFEACNYFILDLNHFTTNQYLSLVNIYNYINNNITKKYLNTMIILIFPKIESIKSSNNQILIDLIKIADVVVFDIKDAVEFTKRLGYKHEEKNFEIRFMFLNEFKGSKYKPYRMVIFLDCFKKLTSIFQETETSLITFYKDFQINIGYKLDYFNVISRHFDLLKYIFFGSFLSRIVLKYPFEFCYEAAESTFKKMLDKLVVNGNNYSTDTKIYEYNKNVPETNEEDYQYRSYGLIKSLNKMIGSGINSNTIDNIEPKKVKFSKKKFAKLKKCFQSFDSRLNKVIDTGNLVSQNLDKILSSNVQHSPNEKNNKSRMSSIPNYEILVGKMMNMSNKDTITGNFRNTPKKLKPILKPYSPSNKAKVNMQEMMNYMNMMNQMNSFYSQNKITQYFSSNVFDK